MITLLRRMRILVTGAGGMLGQDLVSAATRAGFDCAGLTRDELDITEEANTRAAVARARPDVVVNCAAWTDVDGAESATEEAMTVNGDGAGNLARAADAAGAWTVHLSSDYVFDGTKRTPYKESDATNPLSAYGRTKLAGEVAVAREAPSSHTIVRSSWLFGAHGLCFPATILRLARERPELTVVDDQVGCPTFTGHLAQALIALCETRPLGILHVAGSGACSWFELAAETVAAAGLPAQVSPATTAEHPRPAPRPGYSVLGTERARESPTLPHWRDGLAAYMAAIRTSDDESQDLSESAPGPRR
jgi:dTDP-4-dehydrorhamnose reductase